MADKANDEIYKSLIRLFRLYKQESQKGKFYLFSERDVLEEKISLEARTTALSLEEGLHQLGNLVYLALTGKDGNVERTIKIDGYPKLEIFFWPVLEALLASDNPTIEAVEERIREAEGKFKEEDKTSGVRKINKNKAIGDICEILDGTDEETFTEIMEEAKKRLCFRKRQLQNQAKERDPEKLLNEVFNWIEQSLGSGKRKEWIWAFSAESSLVDMYYSGLKIKDAGFTDVEESVMMPEVTKDRSGMDDLLKILKGKRVVSICDPRVDHWYLKVVN